MKTNTLNPIKTKLLLLTLSLSLAVLSDQALAALKCSIVLSGASTAQSTKIKAAARKEEKSDDAKLAAVAEPIEREHELNISDFKGQTYLQMMTAKKGIKANLDADYEQTYKFADAQSILDTLDNFDDKIVKKVMKSFDNKTSGLKKMAQALEGQEFQPSHLLNVIDKNMPEGADVFSLAQLFAFGSGAGTLIIIDKNNYFYNYGYKSGADADNDVKSGRSFAAGTEHKANDASDAFYLNELESYFKQTDDLAPFFETILKVIVRNDNSGYAKLDSLGQSTATDFLTIYTAELDRHVMVDLAPANHPWENDLAEATFVSAFGVTQGKVMIGGELQDGNAVQWWAPSPQNNGRSGIGITRKDRRKLQALMSDSVREKNQKLVDSIEAIVGKRKDGDVFRAFMEFINNNDTQKDVVANADELIKLMTEFLTATYSEADGIQDYVLKNQ